MISDDVRWKIKDGLLIDENEQLVAIMPPVPDETNERILRVAPQSIRAINKFVQDVNNGKLRPRSTAKDFEEILKQFNY